MWYNIQVAKNDSKQNRPTPNQGGCWVARVLSEEPLHKKFTKKVLDKWREMWYNVQVAWERNESKETESNSTEIEQCREWTQRTE